jgi:hypothetical protein
MLVLCAQLSLYYTDTGSPIGTYPVVRELRWRQKLCIAGAGVWGKHVGKLHVVFNQYGVVQSCTGDTMPLDEDVTPVPSIQVSQCSTCAASQSFWQLC